ncbi:MAG: ATP-binding protein [Proteobacteria bacterium]|nr:ATP-binding protein [Pseudomonadota bacterium]
MLEEMHSKFGVLDHVPLGMCLVQRELRILLWNRCLEDWTRIPRKDVLGRPLPELFPHLGSNRFRSRLTEIFAGGPPTIFSSQIHKHIFPCPLPGGAHRVQHTTVTAVRALDGKGYYALFAVQDVSDLTRLVRSAREANAELEAFTYSVSHDLRAPLRSIDGFGEALEEECGPVLSDDGRQYLERLRAAARRMGTLIDDLLHLSRVTTMDMQRGGVDMSRLVEAIGDSLRRTEPSREVDLVVAPNVTAQGDEHLLRVALENLVGNAWKFTGRREAARIEFGLENMGANKVYFVRDNGAGFDMDHANKLFEVFQRLHSASEFEGTGIGLATVQRIIRRHGGKIWGKGKTDKGATMYFTLGEIG